MPVLKTFQNLGNNDIVLPTVFDPTGLASYHVISDTIDVLPSPPLYQNLRGIVRVGLCSVQQINQRCLRHAFWLNDASSRCMVNVLLINDNGFDRFPGDIHFQIRQSSSCVPTLRYEGIYSPHGNGADWDAKGLLVQVSGLLSTSWEVWAEVVPTVDTPNPSKYSWVLEFIFDRVGAVNQAIPGPFTTGALVPP